MKHTLLLPCLFFVCIIRSHAAENVINNNSVTLPCSFTENKGQVIDEEGQPVSHVLAKVSIPQLDVYLTENGITYVIQKFEEDPEAVPHPVYFNEKKFKISYSRVDVELPGSTIKREQFYFADEADWKTSHYNGVNNIEALSHYQTLTVKNIYPNVDWLWKVTPDGKLEYDFIVHAGGSPGDIRMRYKYADVTAGLNQLSIASHSGTIIEGPLLAKSNNTVVDVSYNWNEDTKEITFNTGTYDIAKDFIIDPPLALQWSNLYGGGFADGLRGVATGRGYIYMTGYTTSLNFPSWNPGGAYFDSTFNGTTDAVIMKLDSGQFLKWATYLGGPGNDFGNSVAFGDSANIYLTGGAQAGFPLLTYNGAYNQPTSTGQDAFIMRFSDSLTLKWSTFYGGNGNDEALKILTSGSRVWVCGYTNSTGGSFPTRASNFIQTSVTGNEAFILKFDNNGSSLWATVYGGGGDDFATSLAVSARGDLAVCGYTTSANFPVTPVQNGLYNQLTRSGSVDGFILLFDRLNTRVHSTYYGGNFSDYLTDVTYSGQGSYFFTGRTNSINFPLRTAPGLGFNQTSLSGGFDALIVKMKTDMSLEWSTYYGGSGNDAGTAVGCDGPGENLYATGFTFSTDFPVRFAPGFFQPNNNGLSDGFILGFTYMGARDWATYKGDSCYEYPADLVYDPVYTKFYVVGEGMLDCNGSIPGSSAIDTGTGGTGTVDGFAWAFDDEGNDNPNCHSISTQRLLEPCPEACNGQAALTITGGTAPYYIIWSSGESADTATMLCDGYAWVQVQDGGGCIRERLISLFPLSAGIEFSGPGVGCGQWVVAEGIATNGNPPYTYAWDNGSVTNFSNPIDETGTHYLTVTDSIGCIYTHEFNAYYNDYDPEYRAEFVQYPNCGQNDGIIVAYETATGNTAIVEWEAQGAFFFADTIFNAGFDITYSIYSGFAGCDEGSSYMSMISISSLQGFSEVITDPSGCSANDGSILVVQPTLSAENYPLNYLWSNNSIVNPLEGLAGGDYGLTITDYIGCSVSFSYHLNLFDSIILDFMGNETATVSCQNDSTGSFLQPLITGGTQPFSFMWSTGDTTTFISNLPPGNYSLTVTDDNDCSVAETDLVVMYGNEASVSFISVSPQCFGADNGFIAVNVSDDFGVAPYSYSYAWSNGSADSAINVYQTGVYTVTVTENSGASLAACINIPELTDEFSVDINPTLNDCLTGNRGSAALIGGFSPFVYNWSNGSAADTNTIPFRGVVSLEVTDAAGCIARDSQLVQISEAFEPEYTASTPICHGDTVQVTITASGGFLPYTGVGFYPVTAGNYTYPVIDSVGCSTTLSVEITEPPVFDVTYTSSPVICHGDTSTVIINATGGISPYSGTGPSFLPAGIYSRMVSDSVGCTVELQFAVTEPQGLSVNYSLSPISCGSDTALVMVTASGGVPPYAGIDSSFRPSGSYNYIISDSNGCTKQLEVYVTVPPSLNTNYSATPILCYGNLSTVNITAVGGTSPYTGTGTYSLPVGSYVYTVVDSNGCTDSVSFQVTSPAPLQIGISMSAEITCSLDTLSASVFANGGTVPYQGTGSFIFISDATVNFTVTDANGCISDSLVNINLINDSAVIRIVKDTVCRYNNIILGDGTINNPIWYPGAIATEDYFINVIPHDTIVYATGITDDGCAITDTFKIVVENCGPNGLEEIEAQSFGIYPNPANNFFTISISDKLMGGLATITDVTGRKISAITLVQEQMHIETSTFASGVYFVTVTDTEGHTTSRKLVINR